MRNIISDKPSSKLLVCLIILLSACSSGTSENQTLEDIQIADSAQAKELVEKYAAELSRRSLTAA